MKFLRGAGRQDAGIGKANITKTYAKFDNLSDVECNHVITYIKKDYFALQKCKF